MSQKQEKSGINLQRYTCTRCNGHPEKESDIFSGCRSCGNKLFRLIATSWSPTEGTENQGLSSSMIKNQLSAVSRIAVPRQGVFKIDVDALFQEDRDEPIVIVDEKGKIYLNL